MDPTELEMEDLVDEIESVSSDTTYIVSTQPGPPTTESEVWVHTVSDRKSRKAPTSRPVTASVPPNAEDSSLATVCSEKSPGVSLNKCHICWKQFQTTGALNTHLLIHRQDKFHTSQRVFKQHQLTSHMRTPNKMTYFCTYSGCHKTYNDQNSLKHHCALRHGVHIRSPSCNHPASQWEPVDNHALSKRQSYTADLRDLLMSPRKPVAAHVLKGSSNAEGTCPSPVKPSKRHHESWTLATVSKSYEVKERTENLTLWAPSVPHTVKENPVVSQNDGVIPSNTRGLESSLDFPKRYSKEMLSFQPIRVAATSSLSCPMRAPASSEAVYSKQLKPSLRPRSKLKRQRLSSMFNQSALLCPEPKTDFGSDLPDPVIPTPPALLPKSRKRKYSFSDSEEVLSDLPAHPPLVPQSSHKRSRTRASYLVSPSQVALASFNTSPGKQFFTKESTMKPTGQEQNSCNRTYTRSPSVRRARSHSSCSQGPHDSWEKKEYTSQPCSSTKSLDSTHPGERSQTRKGPSKRPRCFEPLTISSPFSPCLSPLKSTRHQETRGSPGGGATGGHPRQLRSPTYLADHRTSPRFHPPPYTPPPMLSPHRPGTGLYFKTLLQYQQYPPPPSTYSTTLDDVSLTVDNTIINIKPRINVGSRFQAEIPPLRDTLFMLYDEHHAQLVWAPWKGLSTNRKTQKQVTHLLDMCCSSVLTGGGTNIELALHCLHEVQGNIAAALDLLLMREDFRTFGHPLNDYHYTGSDHWTAQEMRLFRKALEDHGKDFQKIHNVLQKKSVAQCVEYYYSMKKMKNFKERAQAAEETDGGKTPVFQVSQETQPKQEKGNTRRSNTRRCVKK